MVRNLKELYQYRALLWALTLRELKARYRASVLGFLWTFLNPTLNMVIYVLVFGYFMKAAVERCEVLEAVEGAVGPLLNSW